MEENYIHIYSSYIADLFNEQKLTFKQVYELMGAFEKVCEKVKDRKGLIDFINLHIKRFPLLETLKQRLLDKTFVFPKAPEGEE